MRFGGSEGTYVGESESRVLSGFGGIFDSKALHQRLQVDPKAGFLLVGLAKKMPSFGYWNCLGYTINKRGVKWRPTF